MKLIIENIDGTETVRSETRQEIIARHVRTMDAHRESMSFLDSILEETGLNAESLAAARTEYKEKAERQQDEGLTTEINTSTSCVSLRDTLDSVTELLQRHPYGFTDGDGEGADVLTSEKPAAVVKVDPYADKKPILKNGKLTWVKV